MTSYRLAAALLGFAAVIGAQEKPPKASIEGVCIDAVLGTPVKDASLLLANGGGAATPASAKSDDKGHFAFHDLEAGRYALIADHPRYAKQTYGSRNGLLGGTMLSLTAGQAMNDVTFKLQPNAVVSGKVLDADGDPVTSVMVAAMKGMYLNAKRQYIPLATAMTNDVGEYRLANLATGKYVISAMPMGPLSGDQAFVTTYYPNATETASAAPIMVPSGGEIGGMDIKMARIKAVHVKGKVAGAAPDQNIVVRLAAKDAGILALVTGRNAPVNKSTGAFDIAGITPGSYILRASDTSGLKSLGSMPIEIGDKRVEGIALNIAPAAELAGNITVEISERTPPANVSLKGARILLESTSGMILVPPNVSVSADGSFTFKDLGADKYFVRVTGGCQSCYTQSVKLGTVEMSSDGLSLGAHGNDKLSITLRTGAASIDGVIRGEDDKPQAGVTVALIPDSRVYLLYQSTFTDQQGAFSFKHITPGDYRVLAWEVVEPNAFQDPEFLKPFEGRAEAVSLKENDHKSITTLKSIR
jgi:protocatechuate 3,4-dioxygenase beta subunit